MCYCWGAGKGDGDREHAMFGMQLRPLELSLQGSASLCHSYIMLQNLITSELEIPIFSISFQYFLLQDWGTMKPGDCPSFRPRAKLRP